MAGLQTQVAELRERIAAEEQKVGEAQKAASDTNKKLEKDRSANNLLLEKANDLNDKLTEEIRQLKEKLQRAEAEVLRGQEELDAMRDNRPTRSETRGEVDREVEAAVKEVVTELVSKIHPNPESRTAEGGEGEDNPPGHYSSSSSDDSDDSEGEEGGGEGVKNDSGEREGEDPGDVRKLTSSGGGDGSGGGGSTQKMLERGKELWMEVYNFATLVPMGNGWKKDKIFILLHLLLEFLEDSKLPDVAKLRSRFNQLLGGLSLFSGREKHGNPLKVAEELWVEAFYFAALVPMDLTWKIKKIHPFLRSLRKHLKSSSAVTKCSRVALKALFGKPPVLAHEQHFFCGSCIHSYGNNVNKPRLADRVHAYVHETILPLREEYIRSV
jgi:hypothetical protein